MFAGENDRAAAEAMLRAFYEHAMHVMSDRPGPDVRSFIHPDADMRLVVSFGRRLRGRTAVLQALEHGPPAVRFRARVRRFEWLDETTSLTFGRARYARPDGSSAEGEVCWLGEMKEGLVWRVRAFQDEADARAAYRADRARV